VINVAPCSSAVHATTKSKSVLGRPLRSRARARSSSEQQAPSRTAARARRESLEAGSVCLPARGLLDTEQQLSEHDQRHRETVRLESIDTGYDTLIPLEQSRDDVGIENVLHFSSGT
jgi:hypothetical protein